jgi:hypothetical protein
MRTLVRVLVGAALSLALAACTALPLPQDLPAIALGQGGLYRLEVALAIFYGFLLLLTPAYSGLASGRLPIEISTRGAKFAAEADEGVERGAATIEKLEQRLAHLDAALANVQIEMNWVRNRDHVTRHDEE